MLSRFQIGGMSMSNGEMSTNEFYPSKDDQQGLSAKRRMYLTLDEVNRLLWTAKQARNGERYHCFILVSWRHGLRVSEAINLLWSDVNWKDQKIRIVREKGGIEQTHPLNPDEIKALKLLYKSRTKGTKYIFTSQQGNIYTRQGIWKIISNLSKEAKLDIHVHPHMLRHTCGTMLAEKDTNPLTIKDYLGQKDIKSALFYIHLAGKQFDALGKWWE